MPTGSRVLRAGRRARNSSAMVSPAQPPPLTAAPTARRFVGVVAGVAASFVAVTIYAQLVQRRIRLDADDIAGNAAPSVQHLGAARAELRHLQALLAAPSLDPAAIADARGEFDGELAAYLALPTLPGETERWNAVTAELSALQSAIGAVLRGGADARAELSRVIDRTSSAIEGSLEFNAGVARQRAIEIAALRERSMLVELALDALATGLALAAALLLLHGVRQYTGLLEAYGELTKSRADELEQFAGRVAHDILSPLNAASMALGMAGTALPDGAPVRSAVARGLGSLQRVQRIVNGLLDFARAGAKPSAGARTDVKPVLDELAFALAEDARRERIDVTVEPFEPCVVGCSDGVLTSLVGNLMTNAIKYMGDAPERRIRVRVRDLGAAARIEVSDTGPGLGDDLRRTVFEPYVRGPKTAGKPGIGLGLATVKRIAESHGGKAGVDSAPGKGSCFWFELRKAAH